MNFLDGFANVHPFFVHTPLVLIPTAALMVWLSLKIRKDGFDTATLLITVAAALGALAAMASGLWAEGTFPHDAALHDLMEKHETNGIVVTVLTCIAALLAVAEWRGWLLKRLCWSRAAILSFATIGVIFGGHMGAQMVYLHGAAVAPVTEMAKKAPAATDQPAHEHSAPSSQIK